MGLWGWLFGRRRDTAAPPAAPDSSGKLIGQSLLRLEINTIIKSNMTGEPMPPLPIALLVGAVVSSTDAAAVFAVLRGAGINLRKRVGQTLELESGLNDPIAVILTLAVTAWAVKGGSPDVPAVLLDIVFQTAVGAAIGVGIGWFIARFGLGWIARRLAPRMPA
jgi:NhaP-type Na+/H+ or K+/H+ antiporter